MAKVTKEMNILEIAQNHPESIEIFQKYGLGCLGCAAARFENLEAGAKFTALILMKWSLKSMHLSVNKLENLNKLQNKKPLKN